MAATAFAAWFKRHDVLPFRTMRAGWWSPPRTLSQASLGRRSTQSSRPVEGLVLQWVAVVGVSGGDDEVQYLAFLVQQQVQLEAVEPSHRTFPHLRQTPEDLVVVVDALVLADTQRGGIHVGDTCAFPKTEHLQHDGHRESLLLHQFHEAVVRHGLRELALHVLAHIVDIEVLEVAERSVMEQHHDGHHLPR